MTPYYQSDRVLLFCGNTTEVLQHWTEPVSVVVVDPPYGDIGFLQQIEDGLRPWDPADVAVWMTRRLYAYQTWLPACKQMVGSGPLWVFQNLQYVPAFQAMARVNHWPPRQVWQLSAEEVLLYCATRNTLTSESIAAIQQASDLNTYSEKNPAWIATLLRASPPGPVLDPFCGRGSSLIAGLLEGRRVIGIELDDTCCAETVARIKEAEALAA